LGILPVVQDGKDLLEAIRTNETVLKQYERDSGRLIRRRYQFPVNTQSTAKTVSGVFPSFLGHSLNTAQVGYGVRATTTIDESKTWFSGAFTYYLPKHGWRRTLSELDRVYGIRPGLETAWNVIPLSFVADYFVNMGDVLRNVDNFSQDGLVMPYGYLMHQSTRTVRESWEGPTRNGNNELVTRRVAGTLKHTSKQRIKATPFGFGLSAGDFTLRQGSIIAALGLNRK
jgi:hypothetical protein